MVWVEFCNANANANHGIQTKDPRCQIQMAKIAVFFKKKSNCSKLNVSWRDNFLNIVHILPVDDGGLRNSSSLHPHHEPTFYSVENKTSHNT